MRESLPNEKELIQDTQAWPNWPYLPVKNYRMVPKGSMPEVGIIFASHVDENAGITVYIVNLFMIRGADLSTVKKLEYKSLDAMLAAGWQGD